MPPSVRMNHVVPGPSARGDVAATVTEVAAEAVCTGEPLSRTVTVKLVVPLVVGVPEI